MFVKRFCFLLFFIFASCGQESPTLSISYSGQDPFADNAVVDIVFCVQNIPQSGQGLDLNNDGIPDLFLFPSTCGGVTTCANSKPASCGVSVNQSGQVSLGDVPLNFVYNLRAEFRDNTGAVLYCGSTQFENKQPLSSLNLPMASGDCP